MKTNFLAVGTTLLLCCGSQVACQPPLPGDQSSQVGADRIDPQSEQMPATRSSGADNDPAGTTQLSASTASDEIPIVSGNYQWPRLLGASFDGTADSGSIRFDWSKQPQMLWTLPVGDGYGLGSVIGDRYYHCDATSKQGQPFERLRAIAMDDAQEIWSVDRPQLYSDLYGYESGPRGTPTSDGKQIVTLGVDGGLCCRSLNDGSLLWEVATNSQYGVVQNFFGVGSSPLLIDDMVIVAIGGSPAEDQRIAPGRLDRVIPNGSAIVAFDSVTGKERWRCGEDLASYSSPRTMQIGDQTVVLYFARDHLIAIDPADGDVLWQEPHRSEILESVNAMIPVVDGNRVFISECYQIGSRLMQVSRDSAVTVWQDPSENRRLQSMRCHWSTPILVDGYLYGCSGRNNPDSDFRCIDFSSGKVQWNDDRRMRSCVALAGDHLVLLEEYGTLQVIRPNPEKLDVVAEHDFSEWIAAPCWAAPIIVGNRMLIRGDRNVICIAIPTLE